MQNEQNIQKLNIQVYEHLSIEITINENRDGYKFKTPKGFGGRFYYSLCNHLDEALQEQYPIIFNELYNNIKYNNGGLTAPIN